MTDRLMIASVTAAMTTLLKARLSQADPNAAGGAAIVTAGLPDLVAQEGSGGGRLNVFMYHVTANDALHGHPPPRPGGAAAPRPLAVSLHYLITAYAEQDLDAETLLETAMLACHENPIVAPDAASGGAANRERMVITLEPLTLDQMSALWRAFRIAYRPSLAYRVSPVFIGS